jgi:hypothetical protein
MNKIFNTDYKPVRRIVTGHNEVGESIFTSDGDTPNVLAQPGKPVAQVVWATGAGRAVGFDPAPAGHKFGFHSDKGSLLRIVDFPPDEVYDQENWLNSSTVKGFETRTSRAILVPQNRIAGLRRGTRR